MIGLVQLAAFLAFFLFLAAQRVSELRVSARHESALRARGAVEVGARHFPFMVGVHAAWFAGMAAEVLVLGARPWAGSPACLALFAAGEGLRSWARSSLGERWTLRVLVLPHEPLVTRGPYRWLRHPNYVAVAVEMAAAPLVFGAWRTALAGAVLYAAALAFRLRVEDAALRAPGLASPVERPAIPLDRPEGQP